MPVVAAPIASVPRPRPLLGGLPSMPVPAPAPAPRATLDQLLALAASGAGSLTWPLDGDLARARNHHSTNRAAELREALAGSDDWFEVDVRRIDGRPVAAHDRTPAPDALRMRDWIRIVAASGRGMKLDFKERAAIAPTLDLVREAGVPDERLVINVRVLDARGVTLEQLRRIRRRFPRATINLSLGDARLTPARLHDAVDLAHAVGGPIAFPIEVSRLTRRVVRVLRTGGSVATWNDLRRSPVRDIPATRRALRALGVNGTVDLR